MVDATIQLFAAQSSPRQRTKAATPSRCLARIPFLSIRLGVSLLPRLPHNYTTRTLSVEKKKNSYIFPAIYFLLARKCISLAAILASSNKIGRIDQETRSLFIPSRFESRAFVHGVLAKVLEVSRHGSTSGVRERCATRAALLCRCFACVHVTGCSRALDKRARFPS